MQKIEKKTKIFATIGPSSDNHDMMKALFEAGMNVIRLNFSHGDHEEQRNKIVIAQQIEKEENQLIGVDLDTKGPEIRTGRFVGKHVVVKKGDKIVLEMGCEDANGNDKLGGKQDDGTILMGITYTGLIHDVNNGHHVRMDDGKLDMVVTGKDEAKGVIYCEATTNDDIKDERGVNCPDTHLSMPYVSEQDRKDLIFGCEQHVNYCSASFVRDKQDIDDIRKIFNENGGKQIRIISKVENTEAIRNIDDVIKYSDGLMVARGDMGVQIPAEDVPVVQMRMIKGARKLGKPIVVATQMLDSMMHSPFPTRAEVSDVANAVLSGADAVMLSGESANGDYPLESVTMQAKICARMEKELDYEKLAKEGFAMSRRQEADAMANAVVNAAYLTDSKLIVCFSKYLESAKRLSHCRPVCPVLFETSNHYAAYDSILYWGVYPALVEKVPSSLKEMEAEAVALAKRYGIPAGSNIIVTGSDPVNSKDTNFMKIVTLEK